MRNRPGLFLLSSIVALPLVLVATSCREQGGTPDGSDGAVDAKPLQPDVLADASEPAGTCLPGATAADCARCEYGLQNCTKACPKVDCSAYPTPAECAGYCANEPCCQCVLFMGNEHWWRQPEERKCTTACEDLKQRYSALLATPAATACEVKEDCLLLFPFSRCDGSASLGYVFNQPVNAKYYQDSGAKELERQFRENCQLETMYDGGPVTLICINKQCRVMHERGCLQRPDAGL